MKPNCASFSHCSFGAAANTKHEAPPRPCPTTGGRKASLGAEMLLTLPASRSQFQPNATVLLSPPGKPNLLPRTEKKMFIYYMVSTSSIPQRNKL